MSSPSLSPAQKRRNQRVSRYQQLVRPLACHYARRCREPLDDLIQVGLLGLLRAAELYSPASGTPFEAFARPHVRGAILHYLRDVAPSLRLPRRLGERQLQVQRALRQFRQDHGRDPGSQELCQRLGFSPAQWQQLEDARRLSVVLPLDPERLEVEAEGAQVELPGGDDDVSAALGLLEPGIREVVRQVVLEGRSYRAAASALQVSPMTVQRRLHRGLAELRQLLSSTTPPCRPVRSAVAAC